MDGKPIHYDGSIKNNETSTDSVINEQFKLTDEMRISISGNPYPNEKIE